jgi:hypothetical protein
MRTVTIRGLTILALLLSIVAVFIATARQSPSKPKGGSVRIVVPDIRMPVSSPVRLETSTAQVKQPVEFAARVQSKGRRADGLFRERHCEYRCE